MIQYLRKNKILTCFKINKNNRIKKIWKAQKKFLRKPRQQKLNNKMK